jgi:hypothetical protein
MLSAVLFLVEFSRIGVNSSKTFEEVSRETAATAAATTTSFP